MLSWKSFSIAIFRTSHSLTPFRRSLADFSYKSKFWLQVDCIIYCFRFTLSILVREVIVVTRVRNRTNFEKIKLINRSKLLLPSISSRPRFKSIKLYFPISCDSTLCILLKVLLPCHIPNFIQSISVNRRSALLLRLALALWLAAVNLFFMTPFH